MAVTPVSNNNVLASSTYNTYNPYGNMFTQPDYFDTIFPMTTTSTQPTTTPAAQTPAPVNEQATAVTENTDIYSQPDNVASALLENYKLAKEIEASYYANAQATQQTATAPVQEVTTNTQNTTVTAPIQTTTANTQTATTVPQQTITTNNGTYSFQDMMIATQIANQFANATPIQPQTTEDIFAQQYNINSIGTNNLNQAAQLNYAA